MGNIKCKCQVVGRRSWCQHVRHSPGSFSHPAQRPLSPNPVLVSHLHLDVLLNCILPKPWQRKATSPPGGSSGCPRCPPGTSSGFCSAGADPPRVKISVAPVGSVQLNRFVPAECVAVRKGHSHPYLILPVPELN